MIEGMLLGDEGRRGGFFIEICWYKISENVKRFEEKF
jgi:hypothetical protein